MRAGFTMPAGEQSLSGQIAAILTGIVHDFAEDHGPEEALAFRNGILVHASLADDFSVELGPCPECEECRSYPGWLFTQVNLGYFDLIDLRAARRQHVRDEVARCRSEYIAILYELGKPTTWAIEHMLPEVVTITRDQIVFAHPVQHFADYLTRNVTLDIPCVNIGWAL